MQGRMGIDVIQRLNKNKGKFFFSLDTMRFFKSRTPQIAIYDTDHNPNKAYFVTSEQFDYNSPRLYTIRVCDMTTGEIDTVGEFQQYSTASKAYQTINKILNKWDS